MVALRLAGGFARRNGRTPLPRGAANGYGPAMVRAFFLAVGQLGDRAILSVLARSLAVTLLLFAILGAGVAAALAGRDPCGVIGLDACPLTGGEGGFVATMLMVGALWLLFPAVAIGVIAAFSDRIVAAVEARHYPDRAVTARPPGWAAEALLGLRSSLRLIGYNLVALPVYLVLLVTGIGTLVAVLAVNGLALGRDLGEMVAVRHGRGAPLHAWLRATRGRRALLGVAVTALFLVPVLNLLAPVLGAAMATHLYHGECA